LVLVPKFVVNLAVFIEFADASSRKQMAGRKLHGEHSSRHGSTSTCHIIHAVLVEFARHREAGTLTDVALEPFRH
jgi:hypothetical protein